MCALKSSKDTLLYPMVELQPPASPWRGAWRRFCKNELAVVGAVIFITLLLATLFFSRVFPFICPNYTPFEGNNLLKLPPSWKHFIGTDVSGYDLMACVVGATEISLVNAILGAACSLLVGLSVGLWAGYFRGVVDLIVMRLADLLDCIPSYFFMIFWFSYAPTPKYFLFPGLVSLYWVGFARTVRGLIIDIKQKEYIEAARACGASQLRICWKHIVPNISSNLARLFGQTVGNFILSEAFLGFLGIGLASPKKGLGCFIWDTTRGGIYETSFWPSMIIFVLVLLSLNMIVDGLRDAFDPKET